MSKFIRHRSRELATLNLALLVCGVAQAQSLPTGKAFDLTVGVGSTYQLSSDTISGGVKSPTVGFTTVAELFSNATTAAFSQLNGTYDSNSASVIRFGYRGLPLTLTTTTGSPAITFSVPG